MSPAFLFWQDFVDRSDYDSAARYLEQLAQMFPAVRLLRFLSQQLVAARERAEELIVQIVAVGEDDERRVLHRGMHDEPTSVERHCQRLARTLRMPDQADAFMADFTSG